MPTITCKIDRAQIEKSTKEQRNAGKRITLADTVCSGLKLIINSKSASWVYAYRKRGYVDGGKRYPQRTMKLGDPITMTPAEARLATEQIKAQVRAGEDPAIVERKERAERQAEEARRRTCEQWLGRYTLERMGNGATKYQRDELRNVRLALDEMGVGSFLPEELTSKHIRSLIELHTARPATSRHRFGAFSRFLDFLLDEEALPLNPANTVSKQRRPKPPAPRTTHFSINEVRRLWHTDGLKPEYQRYLRFMIATPLRAEEASKIRWDQLYREQFELRLLSSDTKNSEYFVMPLTELAMEQIGSPVASQLSKVFQLSLKPDAPMTAWSHFNKSVRKASGIEHFALHHLRRTFSTLMADNSEVPESIIDSLLNHKQSATRGGVIRHYQHAKQLEKRRAAMKVWGELLEGWL